MIFKTAILQQRAKYRAYDDNTQTIIAQMAAAGRKGADILLLPEAYITGYELPISYEEALDVQNPYIDQLCAAAREHHIGVVATAFTKGHLKPRNTAWVINKNGEILLKYDKVHTCDFADESCLECGDNYYVCDFHGIQLGIMICYDREYPESARILMMKGAEVILLPNDCNSMKPRLDCLSTRAYENLVGIGMANPPGENAGASCAFGPRCWNQKGYCIDNALLVADELTEGLFYADFDMDDIRDFREHEMMGNTFRKVHAYMPLLDGEIQPPFERHRGKWDRTFPDREYLARIAQTEALKFYHGELPGAPSNLQEIVKHFPGWTLEEADNSWNAAFVYHCLCKAGFELPLPAIDGSDWTTWVLNDPRLTYIKGSDPSFLPLRGDIVLYEDGVMGIVLATSEAGITTAEGNVNNLSAVLQRPHNMHLRAMIRITNGFN
ncbi:MAG: hypothetical protein IJN10_03860 [Firmicutes bacterium]|nr:hypothetical protein [Bacillota bacterium]